MRRLPLLLLYGCTLLWTWYAGKDLNWDQINYHLYTADLLINNRWDQDYFAGSIQSYLNGLSYVPFYFMVINGWPDLSIALVLASIHFINVALVWHMMPHLLPQGFNQNTPLKFIACLHALATPLFLLTIGGSFNDPLGSGFVLAALSTLVTARSAGAFQWSLAGFLIGVAVGFKLTNGVYAIATLPLLIATKSQNDSNHVSRILKPIVYFGLSAIAAFCLVHGYWSWRLWSSFGNPFFPFFNGIFLSPDFIFANLHDTRFLGEGVWGLIKLPWDMLRSETWVYNEASAPDIRPLALMLVAVLGLASYLATGRQNSMRSMPNLRRASLFIFFSYILWGLSSRIGRYAMPLWILAGPLALAWAATLWHKRSDFVLMFGVLGLCVQVFLVYENGVDRWTSVPYRGTWFDLELPLEITQQPSTLVTTSTQSMSFLSSYVHSNSSMVNLIGQYTQPAGSKMRPRLKKALDNKKMFLIINRSTPTLKQSTLAAHDDMIASYGLRIAGECLKGRLRMELTGIAKGGDNDDSRFTNLFFCPLKRLGNDAMLAAEERANKIDYLFSRVEVQCRGQFEPSGVQSISTGSKTNARTYFNSGTTLYTENEGLYSGAMRTISPVFLGYTDELMAGSNFSCPPKIRTRYLK